MFFMEEEILIFKIGEESCIPFGISCRVLVENIYLFIDKYRKILTTLLFCFDECFLWNPFIFYVCKFSSLREEHI